MIVVAIKVVSFQTVKWGPEHTLDILKCEDLVINVWELYFQCIGQQDTANDYLVCDCKEAQHK